MSRTVKVLKFGGTSLGTVERIQSVAGIVQGVADEFDPIVIVSAIGGVTDSLEAVADEPDPEQSSIRIDEILAKHQTFSKELLTPNERKGYDQVIDAVRVNLVRRIALGRNPGAVRDEILATGERLSAPLVAACLRLASVHVDAWDASSLVRTDATFGEACVDWVTTAENIQRWKETLGGGAVVTGYIGADANGRTTTLGRGGSDYSAAIFAAALGASVLERWTDVDGVYTSDPSVDRDAERLSSIPADEADNLAKDGRIGMHRDSLEPVARKGIPVHVRSTFTPKREGTWIVPKEDERNSK
jgi:aspartate kinase